MISRRVVDNRDLEDRIWKLSQAVMRRIWDNPEDAAYDDPPPGQPWPVERYIQEEVRRQGFVPGTGESFRRIGWMQDTWNYAREKRAVRRYPDFWDVVTMGRLIEREKNAYGLRTCGVRVGSRICPPAEDVPRLLGELIPRIPELAPLDAYRELLVIHPFVDGNGRTGKVVLAWCADSLEALFFPPFDFWGTPPIRNP